MLLQTLIPGLEGNIYGIPVANVATALIILLASYIVGKILYYFFKTWGRRLTAKTKSPLDDILIDILEEPIVIITVLAGVFIAFNSLGIEDGGTYNLVLDLLVVVAIAVATYTGIKLVDLVVKDILMPLTQRTESPLDDQLIPILKRGSKLVIFVMGALMALSQVGVDVTALIAGLGIAGLALAFAAQETIANIFGGISLLVDKTFRIGDKIKLETGEWGYVHDISLRSTQIKTIDNELLVVPNSKLANARVLNYTRPEAKTRGTISLTMVYGTNSQKLKDKALEIIRAHPKVLKDPEPNVLFMELGSHSVNFLCTFWAKDWNEIWGAKFDLNQQLYEGLQEAGFEFAFPTQTIHLEK